MIENHLKVIRRSHKETGIAKDGEDLNGFQKKKLTN